MNTFVAAVLQDRHLPRDTPVEITQTHGQFISAVRRFGDHVWAVIPYMQVMLRGMADLQEQQYQGVSWSTHWKPISQQGYDVLRTNDEVPHDYGNHEYCALMGCIVQWCPFCRDQMRRLGAHFACLDPRAPLTAEAIERQADVIEICLAALRGNHELEDEIGAHLARTGDRLPTIFNHLVQACRTVQWLDACLRTGWLKFERRPVKMLTNLKPHLRAHPFVLAWVRNTASRKAALLALLPRA